MCALTSLNSVWSCPGDIMGIVEVVGVIWGIIMCIAGAGIVIMGLDAPVIVAAPVIPMGFVVGGIGYILIVICKRSDMDKRPKSD